ncbi:glycine oxidase ThiO [Microbacterium sp. X-17]|uniref:glycine oxidase ThiO n=1 Tax=Microbacterium sp. X-17 TaxID=3144404 RepID=UPI0031F5CFE2
MRPRSDRTAVDVAVIGAGIIGLSIAWRAVQSGRSVRVIDPEPARGATFAAAGMLAPVGEYHYQEHDLLPLMLASAARYPEFVRELSPSGEPTGYVRNETLMVGVDHGDRQELADVHLAHRRWELEVEPMTTREARLREPLLGPQVTSAYRVCGDHQIDPRILAARLLDELARSDAAEMVHEHVIGLVRGDAADPESRVVGVRLADGTTLAAGEVVVANGLGATAVEGLPDRLDLPLRPVFGDILRLRVPGTLRPLLTMTVRGRVHGKNVYLVPRTDGTLVVGATQREDGRPGISVGGVHDLLRDAQEIVPAVAELELIEATARARPATPDNAPLLGRVGRDGGGDIPGLVVATGFFRHGVLLAPAAADICLGLLEDRGDARWDAFRPDRFSRPDAAATAGRTLR